MERDKTLSFNLNTIRLQNNLVLANDLNETLFITNEVFQTRRGDTRI